MEPTQGTMKLFMGEFEVVQVNTVGAITINVGRKVHITIYLGDFKHMVKAGDKLPLYTEVPYAHTGHASIE